MSSFPNHRDRWSRKQPPKTPRPRTQLPVEHARSSRSPVGGNLLPRTQTSPPRRNLTNLVSGFTLKETLVIRDLSQKHSRSSGRAKNEIFLVRGEKTEKQRNKATEQKISSASCSRQEYRQSDDGSYDPPSHFTSGKRRGSNRRTKRGKRGTDNGTVRSGESLYSDETFQDPKRSIDGLNESACIEYETRQRDSRVGSISTDRILEDLKKKECKEQQQQQQQPLPDFERLLYDLTSKGETTSSSPTSLADSGMSYSTAPTETLESTNLETKAFPNPNLPQETATEPSGRYSSAGFNASLTDEITGMGTEWEPDTSRPTRLIYESLQKTYNDMVGMEIKDNKGVDLFKEKAEVFKYDFTSFLSRIMAPPLVPPKARHRILRKLPENLSVATSKNWRQIRRQLPPEYEYARFSHDVWTIDATILSSKIIQNLDIRIAGRPVLLNHLPPLVASFGYQPDPAANAPIDQKKDVDDSTLHYLFQLYPGAKAACVFLNKTLLILHEGMVNRRAELEARPRRFGGLKVDHISFKQSHTVGSDAGDSESGVNHVSASEINTIDVGCDGFSIDYTRNGYSSPWPGVRVGLRLRPESGGADVLTMPLHALLKSADCESRHRISKKGDPWYNPARFMDENRDNYDFSYHGDKFGKFHHHFEWNRSHRDGEQSTLLHDIALIKAAEGKPMPYPTFRNSKGRPVKMQWADPEKVDITSGNITLLGFNFQQGARRGGRLDTSCESGAVVLTHMDYQDSKMEVVPLDRDGVIQPGMHRVKLVTGDLPAGSYSDPESRARSDGDVDNDNTPSTIYDRMEVDTSASTCGPSQSTGTRTTPPTPGKELGGIPEGRMYQRCKDAQRTLEYFQRSILWRPDFRVAESGYPEPFGEDGFPSIHGASGCPLAIKEETEEGTVYNIFGFQNSVITHYADPNRNDDSDEGDDDPGLDREHWEESAVFGNFLTCQSLRLPPELLKYDIIWDPPEVRSSSMEPSPEVRVSYLRSRREEHDRKWKRVLTRYSGVSKLRRKSPRVFRIRQRLCHLDLLRSGGEPPSYRNALKRPMSYENIRDARRRLSAPRLRPKTPIIGKFSDDAAGEPSGYRPAKPSDHGAANTKIP